MASGNWIWDLLGFAYGVYRDQNPKDPKQTPIQMTPEQRKLFDQYMAALGRYNGTAAGTSDYITNVINQAGQSANFQPTYKSEYMQGEKLPVSPLANMQLFPGTANGQRPWGSPAGPPQGQATRPRSMGGGGGGREWLTQEKQASGEWNDGFSVEGTGVVGGGYNPFGPSIHDYLQENPSVPSWAIGQQNDRNNPGNTMYSRNVLPNGSIQWISNQTGKSVSFTPSQEAVMSQWMRQSPYSNETLAELGNYMTNYLQTDAGKSWFTNAVDWVKANGESLGVAATGLLTGDPVSTAVGIVKLLWDTFGPGGK